MHSSGMFILNPPYTLEATLREVLPYLVQVLGQDAGATFRIEHGTQVTGAGTGRPATPAGRAAVPGRVPVGNARRASPLSGGGSLRLPGQPFGEAGKRTEGDASKRGDDEGGAPRRPAARFYAEATGSGKAAGKAAKSDAKPGAKSGARTGDGPAPGVRRTQKRNGPGRA
jgi:23S rRNA (adenine2030-N6)-methyltransferase